MQGRKERWLVAAALGSIMLIGAALRIALIDQPMRYDEAVTYVEYVRPAASPLSILQSYRPNNHILHTLLVCISTRLFGDAEWAIRLPALIAGLALIPAAYVAFRDAAGHAAGLLAAAFVAGSSPLVFYSVNARGYTLIALMTLVSFMAAQRALRANSWRSWGAIAIALSLGFWTIPVMAFPCAAIIVWLALEAIFGIETTSRRRFFTRFAACAFATFSLTALLYAPTIRAVGISEITSNKFVITHGIDRFLRELRVTPVEVARMWTADIPRPLGWIVHAAAFASVFLPITSRRHRMPLLAVALIASLAVLWAMLRIPPARVWVWLLPLYLGCAAMTIAWAARRFTQSRVAIAVAAVMLAVLLCACVWIVGSVRDSTDTGSFPRAREAAAMLKSHVRTADRVVASTPADGPLAYYLARRGIEPGIFETAAPRRLYIVLLRGEALDDLLRRRGINPGQFHSSELLADFGNAAVFAAARMRAATTRSSD